MERKRLLTNYGVETNTGFYGKIKKLNENDTVVLERLIKVPDLDEHKIVHKEDIKRILTEDQLKAFLKKYSPKF